MELGKQIKKHRQEVQLSQEKLADRVYVSRQTISNWENEPLWKNKQKKKTSRTSSKREGGPLWKNLYYNADCHCSFGSSAIYVAWRLGIHPLGNHLGTLYVLCLSG